MVGKKKVLIIHKDVLESNLISFSIETNFNFESNYLSSPAEAPSYLKNKDDTLLLLIDQTFPEESIKALLSYLEQEKLEAPIFLMNSDDNFKNPVIREYISKENLLLFLQNSIEKYFEAEKSDNDEFQYVSMAIKALEKFNGINDDIFIKLKSRYIKLFSKEDHISHDDIQKYISKGVQELYLKKFTSTWVLNEINKDYLENINKLRNGNRLDLDSSQRGQKDCENSEAVSKEDVTKIHSTFNLDEAFIEKLNSTVLNTQKKIKKNPRLNDLFKKINIKRDGNYLGNHIGLLCNVTCGIASLLDWKNEATLQKIILVCYLHDITLSDRPDLAICQTLEDFEKIKDKLSEDDQNLYLKHPEEAAKLLENVPDMPPDIGKIIIQHHERPDKSGFPNKINHRRIIPLATLFIVSHELVNYMIDNEKWSIKEFLKTRMDVFVGQQFRKIMNVLQDIK